MGDDLEVPSDEIAIPVLVICFFAAVFALGQVCASPATGPSSAPLQFRFINLVTSFLFFVMSIFALLHFHSSKNGLVVVILILVRSGTGILLSIGALMFLTTVFDTLYKRNRGIKAPRPLQLSFASLTIIHAIVLFIAVVVSFALADQYWLDIYYTFVSFYASLLAVCVIYGLSDVLWNMHKTITKLAANIRSNHASQISLPGSTNLVNSNKSNNNNQSNISPKSPRLKNAPSSKEDERAKAKKRTLELARQSSQKESVFVRMPSGGNKNNPQKNLQIQINGADSGPAAANAENGGTDGGDTGKAGSASPKPDDEKDGNEPTKATAEMILKQLKTTSWKLQAIWLACIGFIGFQSWSIYNKLDELSHHRLYSPLMSTGSYLSLILFYGFVLGVFIAWTYIPFKCTQEDEITICYLCCLGSDVSFEAQNMFEDEEDEDDENEAGGGNGHTSGKKRKKRGGDADDEGHGNMVEETRIPGAIQSKVGEGTVNITAFPGAMKDKLLADTQKIVDRKGVHVPTRVLIINAEVLFEDRRIFRKALSKSFKIEHYTYKILISNLGGERYLKRLEETLYQWGLDALIFIYHPTVKTAILQSVMDRLRLTNCFIGSVTDIFQECEDEKILNDYEYRVIGIDSPLLKMEETVISGITNAALKRDDERKGMTGASLLSAPGSDNEEDEDDDYSGQLSLVTKRGIQSLVLEMIKVFKIDHDAVLYLDHDRQSIESIRSINLCKAMLLAPAVHKSARESQRAIHAVFTRKVFDNISKRIVLPKGSGNQF